MLGAMEGEEAKGKLLSYEGPFGVGYGVMSFNNEEKGDVKLESLINMKKEILNKKISTSENKETSKVVASFSWSRI